MVEEDSPEEEETFCSDMIDLNAVDLAGLDWLPSPVLRASLQRVWRELAEDGEASAYFQNSLRHPRSTEESHLPPSGSSDESNNDQLRKRCHNCCNRTWYTEPRERAQATSESFRL